MQFFRTEAQLSLLKVVVRAEILLRDFLQTSGNYCWRRIKTKIQSLKNLVNF